MTVDSARTDQPSIGQIERTRTMRVPRTRGAVSGLLLVLLGAWGALAPFIGPYFDFSYGSDQHWVWSAARGWLEVLPGAVAGFGGLVVLASKNRVRGSFGAWLAILGGAWFVVGRSLAPVWHIGSVGEPLSTRPAGRAAADLAYFYGLGAVIIFLAAFALGRLAVVGVRDLIVAERDETRAAEAAAAAEAARQAELDRQLEAERARAAERDAAERNGAERNAAEHDVAGRTGDRVADDRQAAEAGTAGAGVAGAAEARTHHRVADERVADERAADERVADGRTDERVVDSRIGDRRADERVADDRTAELRNDRTGSYDPNDGRSDGFGHAPAHSADQPVTGDRNPYDQEADGR